MSNSDIIVSLHPIVILGISEFYNRMKWNNNTKRVFGGIIGEKTGSKIEILSNFEFLDKSDPAKNKIVDLDLEFLEERYKTVEQLFPNYEFVGLFSVGENTMADEQDKIIAKHLIKFGVINPIALILSSDLLDKEELPLKVFSYDKHSENFTQVHHEIVGYDSERICIDTVTKSGGVQNNDSQIVQNMDTIRSALSMLKSNLKTVLYQMKQPENQSSQEFAELLNDIIVNHPNSSDPDLKQLLDTSMEEMLILNNIVASSVGINYSSKV